jgi:hypothetical protein
MIASDIALKHGFQSNFAGVLAQLKVDHYHPWWFRDGRGTIGSFVPSEIVFGAAIVSKNLTPNPFPSGKGNRMRGRTPSSSGKGNRMEKRHWKDRWNWARWGA